MAQRKDYCKIELTGPDRESIVKALRQTIKLVEQGNHSFHGYLNKTTSTMIYKEKE